MRDFTSFLDDATCVASPELCPEIRLHLASQLPALWSEQEQWVGHVGLSAPYWGVAWPGGQALARYILDNPESVRGASVLDLGSGSGLCAIAAAKAGARSVEAVDTDRFAIQAIRANARLNGVEVTVLEGDLLGSVARWDVVLAGDLWYERFLAERVTGWVRGMAQRGKRVFLGDSDRAFFPRGAMTQLGSYPVQTPQGLEMDAVTVGKVWTLVFAYLPYQTRMA